MRIEYETADGRTKITGEAQNIKDAVKAMSQIQLVFEGNVCGQCSAVAFLEHRIAQGYEFYAKRCSNPECNAQLDLGQHREGGTLFVKLRDDQGNVIGRNGWYIYQHESKPAGEVPDGTGAPTDANVPF